MMERFNGEHSTQESSSQLMLLYIRATEQAHPALQRAAQRIKYHVRGNDIVLLQHAACAVLLFDTPFIGAQAVAKRIYGLLADIDYELQIISGPAAQLLLQRLRSDGAVSVNGLAEPVDIRSFQHTEQLHDEENDLPYLAFLVNYPSHRLLHLFPYELACHYRCVPVGVERDVITVATCQRLPHEAITHVREVTRRNIFQVRCEAGIIEDVLHYWQGRIQHKNADSACQAGTVEDSTTIPTRRLEHHTS